MNTLWASATLLLLSAAFTSQGPATPPAQLLGVGLNFDSKIFVQEYWREGVPYYAIANSQGSAARIAAYDRRSNQLVGGPWETGPGRVVHASAASLLGKDLIEFRTDGGTTLGLLNAPVAPREPGNGASFVSYYGLNGSGGRQEDLWFEQQSLSFKPGAPIELTLVVKSNSGQIVYTRTKSRILSAQSDGLTISDSEDRILIDTASATGNQVYHRIQLRFAAPNVQPGGMAIIEGWRWTVPSRSGHAVVRGVAIASR